MKQRKQKPRFLGLIHHLRTIALDDFMVRIKVSLNYFPARGRTDPETSNWAGEFGDCVRESACRFADMVAQAILVERRRYDNFLESEVLKASLDFVKELSSESWALHFYSSLFVSEGPGYRLPKSEREAIIRKATWEMGDVGYEILSRIYIRAQMLLPVSLAPPTKSDRLGLFLTTPFTVGARKTQIEICHLIDVENSGPGGIKFPVPKTWFKKTKSRLWADASYKHSATHSRVKKLLSTTISKTKQKYHLE